MIAVVNGPLTADLAVTSDFQASPCMSCGVCTAVCPMGIDLLPRTMFRYALLGLEGKLVDNIPALYSCLLCRLCEANCPADVPIAENIRLLRRWVNQRVFDL